MSASKLMGDAAINQKGNKHLIGQALDRHTIENSYNTIYPKFLRSQGPFCVYDHAKVKGGTTQ
jgi:hypothetical protein